MGPGKSKKKYPTEEPIKKAIDVTAMKIKVGTVWRPEATWSMKGDWFSGDEPGRIIVPNKATQVFLIHSGNSNMHLEKDRTLQQNLLANGDASHHNYNFNINSPILFMNYWHLI